MIVIDTSVAIKWLRANEEDRQYAFTIYKNHLEHKDEIMVPSLFYIEAANALATNNVLSRKDILEGMEFLFNSGLYVHDVTRDDVLKAAALARKYKTTVYDMIYAVIAKENNIILITADEKFVRKVGFPFVRSLRQDI